MKQQYRYKAFISYSHRDKWLAARLQRKLEDFKSPKQIIAISDNKDERIGNLFRDKTDLSGYLLTEALQSALEQSEYLLVCCSRNSARSKWVNLEIQHFVNSGRTDKIIPVILPSFPNRNRQQIIPQALRLLYDQGANVRKPVSFSFARSGWINNNGVLRLTNLLRGLESDTGLDSFIEKHFIATFAKMFGLLCCTVVFISDIGVFNTRLAQRFGVYETVYWDSNMHIQGTNPHFFPKENEEYYRLIPHGGISPFKNNQFITRVEHRREEGKTYNIPGQYLWDADILLLSYDVNTVHGIHTRRLSKMILQNADGSVRMVKNYALTSGIADLSLADTSPEPVLLPNDYTLCDWDTTQQLSTEALPVCRIGEIYDASNYLSQIWFLSNTDSYMIPDIHGYYGLEYLRDASGKITYVNYLDQDGNVMASEFCGSEEGKT